MHVLMATKLLPSPMQLYLMQWRDLGIEAHLRITMDVDEGRGRGDGLYKLDQVSKQQ